MSTPSVEGRETTAGCEGESVHIPEVAAVFSEARGEADPPVGEESRPLRDDLGKGVAEEGADVSSPVVEYFFPQGFNVDPTLFPLLNSIGRAFPETFANFHAGSRFMGSTWLRILHDYVSMWAHMSTQEVVEAGAEEFEDFQAHALQVVGIDLSWMRDRGRMVRASVEREAVSRELQESMDAFDLSNRRMGELRAELEAVGQESERHRARWTAAEARLLELEVLAPQPVDLSAAFLGPDILPP
jgi:hypothetical protein